MRFLMIGISIIIGVILVGVVFSVTTDLTQPREVEKVVSFEIFTEDGAGGTLTPGTYDNIISIVHDQDYYDNNIIETTIIYNNTTVTFDGIYFGSLSVEFVFIDNDMGQYLEIYTNDEFAFNGTVEISTNEQFQLIFTVMETQISSTSAILIALVPLLFATGVILYTYNTALRGREE